MSFEVADKLNDSGKNQLVSTEYLCFTANLCALGLNSLPYFNQVSSLQQETVMPFCCLCGVHSCVPRQGCVLLQDWQVCAACTPKRANEEEIQFLTHPRLQSVSSSQLLVASEEQGSASHLGKAGCQDTARRLKPLQSKIMRHFKLEPLAQQKATYGNINFRHKKKHRMFWLGLGGTLKIISFQSPYHRQGYLALDQVV